MKELLIGFVLGFLIAYQMRKEQVTSGVVFNQYPSQNPADYLLW